MKFTTSRAGRALVIGFFQSQETGGTALKNLRRDGFRRSAAVHCSGGGEVRVDEHGISVGRGALGSAVIGLLVGMLVLQLRGALMQPGALLGVALPLAAFALAGALAGWGVFRRLDARVDPTEIAKFKRWIVPNETVVLAEVPAEETARVVASLRAGDGEPPVTFSFHASSALELEPEANLLRNEAPSSQRLGVPGFFI